MAAQGFEGNLTDPQRMYAPYGNGGGGSDIGGSLVGGLANAAGVYFKREGEKQTMTEGNDLAKQIGDVVLDHASAGPPALVGQGTGNPQTDAGANSSTGKQLASDLNRMGQAGQQGMSELEKLTRVSSMVQDAVNKDPIHADYYRSLAKETLGVTPTAEIFKLQNEASQFTTALSQDVYKTNVSAAAEAGITLLKEDGTPDLQAMAGAGAKLLQTEKDADLKLKAATLAAAQAKPTLSHEDQVSAETSSVMDGLHPVLEQVHGSIFQNLPALIAKYGAAGKDQTIQQLGVDLNNQQAQVMGYIDKFGVDHSVSPEAMGKVRNEVRQQFDDMRTVFGDPKMSLDQISANARTLKDAQTLGQMNFRTMMPTAARLKDAVGDQGIAAFFAQNSILNPGVSSTLQGETQGFLNGKPSPTDVAGAATSAFKGEYNVANEQRPAWQSAVTTGIVKTVNLLAQTPDKLTPEQQTAFGHSMVQISNVALNDKSPKNLENAASILNAPGIMRTFQNFAKSPDNADHVPIVAMGMSSLLYQHIASARRTLIQGAETTVQVPGDVGLGANPRAANGLALQNTPVTVHGDAVYNPASGKVEFNMTATNSRGEPVKLTPQQASTAQSGLSDYKNSVDQVNRSLDNLTVLKDYTHEGTENFKPLEMKGVTISSIGLPVKDGMHIPLPVSSKNFTDTTDQLESHGKGGKNPLSSAEGLGQFTKGTWLGLAKQAMPDEVKGLSDTQILNLRKDKNLNDRMVEEYKIQNTSKLKLAGIDNPDNADLYMAHHFGPGDAIKILNAPVHAPIESLLSPEVIKANPDLKGMTPMKLYQKYSQAFGGQAG